MSSGIGRLFEDAGDLADHYRFIPAIEKMEKAKVLTKHPTRRAWAGYNLGTIYWHRLGDGLNARKYFLATIADFDTYGYGNSPALMVMYANALENAMLCALSYDEFENLAAELQNLTPNAAILIQLVPGFHEARERGDAWSDQLFYLASTYYNRNDPLKDVGRYGEAKSTYHLILAHRRELRLPREKWSMAIYEYCALSMRMVSDCFLARGGDKDPSPPSEFLPILTDAIPYIDDYLEINSGDEVLQKVRTDMVEMNEMFLHRESTKIRRNPNKSAEYEIHVCKQCGIVNHRQEINEPNFFNETSKISDNPAKCPTCGGEDIVWLYPSEMAFKIGRRTIFFLLITISFIIIIVTYFFGYL